MPFKGELSTTARAMHQRDRAASRTEEEQAVENAKAADRAAKYQLKSKFKKNAENNKLSEENREKLLQRDLETMDDKRF